ncbi:hypothetical protein Gorai_006023 [Gossypium raimondii]|uniref:Uncharacterized protein n=1 Tax=Gossypium raimondii TaxID=29730 RepID=A0A7J8QEX1_GOSRA|nr:hypothetical protein [Gossypium raimondii]
MIQGFLQNSYISNATQLMEMVSKGFSAEIYTPPYFWIWSYDPINQS